MIGLALERNIGAREETDVETERVLDAETRCVLGGTQKTKLAHDQLLSKPSDEGARAALAAVDLRERRRDAAGPAE